MDLDPRYVTWDAPNHDHPARRASQLSAMTVCTGTKEQWLALFADDAVVEDPVGPSMFDPEAAGHHGHQGIGRFWDAAISTVDRFHFTIRDSHANGDTCANIGTITTWMGETRVDTDLVMIYRVAVDGRIVSMRAHWEPDRAMATARKESPPRDHPAVLVVGEGPVSEVIAPMIASLGWTALSATDLESVGNALPRADAVVVLSHHEELDGPALQLALASDVGYIGAMGSRRTQSRRRDWLQSRGVTDQSRIHGPAGLDIGADDPAEIALSILAEMLAVLRGRHLGAGLKDRPGPIHPELAPGASYCPEG